MIVTTSDINGNTYKVPESQLVERRSVYGIVIKGGSLLLITQLGTMHLPGGAIDPGETSEAAVIREVNEETGINVANPRHISDTESFFTDPGPTPPKHFRSLIGFYACDRVGGEFSTEGCGPWERAVGLTPSWVPLSDLDTITPGSTFDWLSVVKREIVKQSTAKHENFGH